MIALVSRVLKSETPQNGEVVTVNLGVIEFDERVMLRQLRQDMKDDWFPDALLFEDAISSDQLRQRIEANFDQNHGAYVPAPRDLFNVPKPDFTVRYGLETSLNDRLVYHSLASSISRRVDSLIPPIVFSHRRDPHNQNERYFFRRSIQAWQDFIGSVRADLAPNEVLLSTDLTNYFDNIDLKKLNQTLSDLVVEAKCDSAAKARLRAEVSLLTELLRSWSFSSERGIPQNRDASSFLANIYMLPIDRTMKAKGYRYFRYMDDIKIVASNVYSAREALQDLIVELRESGLAVNSKKTKICPAEDSSGIHDCLDAGSSDIDVLDSMWATRSRHVIARSFPILQALTIKLLQDGDGQGVNSREFRYCMNRLIILATCTEFAVPDDYYATITPLVVGRLAENPAATDQFVRYLRAVPLSQTDEDQLTSFLCDPHRAIYGWQNYKLWKLVGQRALVRADLLEHAREVVNERDDGTARAGASLYLGAHGENEDRKLIAVRFASLTTYLGQRSALVAIQSLPYRPHVEDHVGPTVRSDLNGIYRGLSNSQTRYYAPLECTSITHIVDTERDYA